jgi:hypothetical protein
MRSGEGKKLGVATAAACLLLMLLFAAPSLAAPPEFILQIPENQVSPGEGAAELDNPRDIVGNPDTGHIYISDVGNSRITEYTAWGLFVKAWGWGVEDGSNEEQTCEPAQPETSPPPSLCRIGLPGDGRGQFDGPLGQTSLALDGSGNVYVYENENLRVQKFSPAGQFLLMFGGGVNQTKVTEGAPAAQQNVCPVDDGDVCGAGTSGTGPSYFTPTSGVFGNYISYDPVANTIVVGDKDRIQIFELDGTFKAEIPFTGPLADFAGDSVNALEVDEDGNIYFSLANHEDVYKISATGEPLAPGEPGESQFKAPDPRAGLTVDVEGNVYVIDTSPLKPGGTAQWKVIKFDAEGNRLVPTKEEEEAGLTTEARGELFPYVSAQTSSLSGLGANICAGSEAPGNLYIAFFDPSRASHVNAYGSGPIGCEPPPVHAPEILEQFATSIGREEATLRARINPRFFTDVTYYVEYGAGECSLGGCPNKQPIPAALLTNKSINKGVTTAGVVLSGLEPGTTYHYRFVAESEEVAESEGEGPVFGEDPDGQGGPDEATFELGVDRTFKTFAPAGASACANEALRTGTAARLPDCRGYEMVTPLEKGSADVAPWQGRNGISPLLFEVHQGAAQGERFTFTSSTSFGDSGGAGFTSQYLAQRGGGGWFTQGISPPRTASPIFTDSLLTDEFQGFSQDLCQGWLRHFSVAPLAEGGVPKYLNLYRRENCAGSPSYLPLTTAPPEGKGAEKYFEVRVQGFSEDGSHTVFNANGKLDPDAPGEPPLGELDFLLYEHSPAGLRFVCYLPNNTPVKQPCAAGTPGGLSGGSTSSVHNAISADGERIFWTAYSGVVGFGVEPGAPGRIYARIGGAETKRVSQAVSSSPDPAWFWTASEDGSKAIIAFDDSDAAFTHADELYEVDVNTEPPTPNLIAEGVEGPMGASEDASRIYFASTEDLDEAGEGTAGAHNLYLYEAAPEGGEPTYTFIMALAADDIGGSEDSPAPVDVIPAHRSARVSADGLHATFVSAASPTPTGYDNRDAESGAPAREVYHYDAVEERLLCISCNPTGARPAAGSLGIGAQGPVGTAARIQGWEALNHAPRVMSADGRRVFFESFGALAPEDTNGRWDVYQWEEAGKGTCTTGSASYGEDAQGCVDLISSGESDRDAIFLDADVSGESVFFGTLASLVGSDYGLNDVYVARVGGGFPEEVTQPECEGEACQSPPAPPPDVTPASEAFEGPENEKATKRCRRGQRKVRRGGKVRCVKKAKRGKGKHRKGKGRKAGRGAAR